MARLAASTSEARACGNRFMSSMWGFASLLTSLLPVPIRAYHVFRRMNPLRQSRSLRHKLNFIVVAATILALGLSGAALVLFDLRNQIRKHPARPRRPGRHRRAGQQRRVGIRRHQGRRREPSRLACQPGHRRRGALQRARAACSPATRPRPPPGRAAAADRRSSRASLLDSEWVHVLAAGGGQPRRSIGSVYLQARHDLGPRALEYLLVLCAILAAACWRRCCCRTGCRQRGVTGPLLALSEVPRSASWAATSACGAQKTSDDEVGALVDAFNAMLDELGRARATLEEANRALRASEERYQLAVRGSSAGLWDWDLRGRTMFYSPRLKAMLGYTRRGISRTVPTSMLPVVHPGGPRRGARQALRRPPGAGKPYQVECRLRIAVGRMALVPDRRHGAARRATGRPYRMAGSVVDVTERKQAEQVLQRRQPRQGRIPRHAGARAAQPAGADPHRPGDPEARHAATAAPRSARATSWSASWRTWSG